MTPRQHPSEPPGPDVGSPERRALPAPAPGEEVDGVPVLAEAPRAPAPAARALPVPAVQAAALAAGGFLAGVVTVAASRRRSLRRRRRRGRRALLGEIVTTNSFLVDVHVLRRD